MISFSSLAILTLLTEEITNIFKSSFPKIVTRSRKSLVAILVGILLAISTKAGLLSTLGFNITYPLIDFIATGVIISRGSNFLHDLIEQANITKHIKRQNNKRSL